jgi:hypothetical protein
MIKFDVKIKGDKHLEMKEVLIISLHYIIFYIPSGNRLTCSFRF